MGTFPLHADVKFTYRDYALLPQDGRRHELINGDFHVSPAPATIHQRILMRLAVALDTQLARSGLAEIFPAPFDVILSDVDTVQPDLVVISKARAHLLTERGLEGAPDLVVEILSPNDPSYDRHVKRGLYARAGIPEYWLVEPRLGQVEVLGLEPDGYKLLGRFDRVSTLASRVFEQLAIPLEPIFTQPQ